MNRLEQETIVHLKNLINGIETGAMVVKQTHWDVIRRDLPEDYAAVPMVEHIGETLTVETRYIGYEDKNP